MGRHRKQGRGGRGGGGRGGGRGRGGRDRDDRGDQGDGQRGSYKMVEKENKQFEEYYKAQEIVPEGEWDDFMAKLRAPLPATFRITGNRSEAKEVLKKVEGEYMSKLMDVKFEDDGVTLDPPTSLPWYPDNLAWQLGLSRKFIRHNDTLQKLHTFLISETESGNISRQEAVSMIPPLVLDIEPKHRVLDMCAAPGSKTTQLIEYLHQGEGMPEGFVVANDADNKRCYLMVHQVKRLESPCFVIVNHDASQMPSFRLNPLEEDKRETLRYDRILADVPCSGDGTLRKNPDVWGKWNAAGGNNLHHLQLRILRRGLEMLEVGGRLVYSTCSFNPIEDEAVLASMLQQCQGSVELTEVADLLPGLKYTQGKSSWKVYSRFGETFEKFEDVPEKLTTQIRQSMFPPPPEEVEKLNLNRCLRILPHHQNTGGFFIAALTKTAELPWMKISKQQEATKEKSEQKEEEDKEKTEDQKEGEEKPSEEEENGDDRKRKAQTQRTGSPPPYKKQRFHGYREDPFIFLKADDAMFPPVRKFFDVSEEYPVEQMLVRCDTGKRRHIYFTSPQIRKLVLYNTDRIRFINLGLKVLSRSETKYSECDYRLVQEGVQILYPYVNKRIVKLPSEDVITLLSTENPFLSRFSLATSKTIEDLNAQGSVIFRYLAKDNEIGPRCDLVIAGWLGRTSCRSFLQKNNRAHVLRLFGKELKTKEEIEELKQAKTQVKLDKDGETEDGDSIEEENEEDIVKDEKDIVEESKKESDGDIMEASNTVTGEDVVEDSKKVTEGDIMESKKEESKDSEELNTPTNGAKETEKDS